MPASAVFTLTDPNEYQRAIRVTDVEIVVTDVGELVIIELFEFRAVIAAHSPQHGSLSFPKSFSVVPLRASRMADLVAPGSWKRSLRAGLQE